MGVKPSYEQLERTVAQLERELATRERSERALLKAERRLRSLLDFIPYAFVVYTHEGGVYYLNPAFTETFGWTLDELEGEHIPFIPAGLEHETRDYARRLSEENVLQRHETKRLTKDGRVLDVAIRAIRYPRYENEPSGSLAIIRDITRQKRLARINETILRISTALPQYPVLEQLLYFINGEVKRLLSVEGSLVILLDEDTRELFVLAPVYDDIATQKRVKEVRFSLDKLVAGRVIRSGTPLIVSDTGTDPHLHSARDKILGYHTRNLLLVPLKEKERISGVLCALNKKDGDFDQEDVELLSMVAGTVALSIENARYSEELKRAYDEVTSINRAKDKVINHLAHELKTPVGILIGSLGLLEKHLSSLPERLWKPNIERLHRNLARISSIEREVNDIMEDRRFSPHPVLSLLLDQCADELEVLLGEQDADPAAIQRIRRRIDELFGPKEAIPENVDLAQVVARIVEESKASAPHRRVEIVETAEPCPPVYVPVEVLHKVVGGLVRNAVENTPDEGRIEVSVRRKGPGTEMVVHDYGVGIQDEAKRHIFEGFFVTQDTLDYSSKHPFDFNAGGKGADLLRMKIFSERYGFIIRMESTRCPHLEGSTGRCPGAIHACPHCEAGSDCGQSGGTAVTVVFPPAADQAPPA